MNNSVNTSISAEIQSRLSGIEQSEGVRIIYACESGSRAWGFASTDSDYDVRFIYVRPVDWYLSIDVENQRDVIELPIEGDLDINGWDLRKALRLLRKSNPPLLEWLGSPIVYRESGPEANALRELVKRFFCSTSCAFHYLSMARRNYQAYLQGDEISLKKYLYVLRPLLAVKWIERGFGLVPTEFRPLCDRLIDDSELQSSIAELLEKKQSGIEMGKGPRIAIISDFVEKELLRLQSEIVGKEQKPVPVAELNQVFRTSLAGP
jgi:uncharacterized protein